MGPSTSTDHDKGTLLDGKARSAQWRDREAERKAAEARKAADATDDHDPPGADIRYSPPTDFGRSLMIPADQLPRNLGSTSDANGAPSDAYMEELIAQAADPTNDAATAPSGADDGQTDTDRFFERQAISLPRPVARHAIAGGTASLTLPETPARRRQPRIRAPRLRRTPARDKASPTLSPTLIQRSATFAGGRLLVIAGCAALLAAAAATGIANSFSTSSRPARHAEVALEPAAQSASTNTLADALGATIAAITPRFRAIATVTITHRSSHARGKPAHHQAGDRGPGPSHHSAAVSRPTPAAGSSNGFTSSAPARSQSTSSGASPSETHTYTPPSTSSTSHTSAGSQTPATHSSQPAGPTQSNPLGGIGSCVSGCT